MAKCKYPNEVCTNMTVLNGETYCDSVPCSLKDELPKQTGTEHIGCRKKARNSMRIYISGPITGTDDYMERFAEAEERLIEAGYSVINPASVNSMMPADTTYEEYMTMSFAMLNMCGAIYMMEGWEKSCGANREYGYALANDYIILREE